MAEHHDQRPARGKRSRRQAWLIGLLVMIAVGAHLTVVMHRRAKHGGDFNVNREFGRRLLAGEPLYEGGLCFNYMPISALYWAPLAMLPADVAIVVRYAVALGCLAYVVRTLSRMVGSVRPEFWRQRAFVVPVSLLLAGHYVVRDLDDGGPNLILLAIFVAGIDAAWRERTKRAALWFGLGIALKMTPGLFVPFFLWKRRWSLAAGTLLATAGWIALPAVWMGPAAWWNHQMQWNRMALTLVGGGSDARRDENELRVQNQTLALAVKRLVIDYPQDHPLRAGLRLRTAVWNVSPDRAEQLAKFAMLGLLAICCWRGRAAYAGPGDPSWPAETSQVLLLMLLLSPVTWLQHMVYAIPAIFLIVSESRLSGGLPRAARALMAAYATMSLVLNRELLGRENYLVLLSLHMHTLCMLILLGLLIWLRPLASKIHGRQDGQSDRSLPSDQSLRRAERRVPTTKPPLRRAG